MKNLMLLLPLLLAPTPVMSQQINYTNVCTQYREVYTPGGHDYYGYYYVGKVTTERHTVPCNQITHSDAEPTRNRRQKRTRAATPVGAILGGIGGYTSTKRVADRWYMIPLGILGGGVVGNALC
jgi:hypothetical protein